MDINKILKSDYLDILFEGRNKKYGGYELRKKYPQRARNAAIGTILAAILIALGPVIASSIKKKEPKPVVSIKQVTLAEPPPIDPDKPKPPPPPPAPPPPVKPTVKFTPPVIKKDEEVKEEEKPTPPDPEKKEVAGPTTNTGGDPNGIDPGISDAPGTGTAPVEAPAAPEIFKYVEQMPEFPGNVQDWLARNVRYPERAHEAGTEGRVIIQFVVNENGAISGVEVVRSSGSNDLDNEGKRAVAAMPKWKPGKQNGREVKVYYTLPITFKLD